MMFLIGFGTFKIPIKIGIPFSFVNFRTMFFHLIFDKSNFGKSKESSYGS